MTSDPSEAEESPDPDRDRETEAPEPARPSVASDDTQEQRSGPPTPVRAMMGEPDAGLSDEGPSEETPSREIEVRGERWTAHAVGRTRSGTSPDPGAPLLLIAFARTEDPADFAWEGLTVAESLAEISDDELQELFERARPFRPLPDPEEREERRTSPVRKDLRRR